MKESPLLKDKESKRWARFSKISPGKLFGIKEMSHPRGWLAEASC